MGGVKPHIRCESMLIERIFQLRKGHLMNNIVYIVGAIVIIIAILSFFGLR